MLLRLVLLDHVLATGAVTVELVGQLAGRPQRQRTPEHRLVDGLAVGEVDAPEGELCRGAVGRRNRMAQDLWPEGFG